MPSSMKLNGSEQYPGEARCLVERSKAGISKQVGHIAADDPQSARRITVVPQEVGAALGELATVHPGRVNGAYDKSARGLPYIIAYALTDGDQAVSSLRVIPTVRDWQDDRWPD